MTSTSIKIMSGDLHLLLKKTHTAIMFLSSHSVYLSTLRTKAIGEPDFLYVQPSANLGRSPDSVLAPLWGNGRPLLDRERELRLSGRITRMPPERRFPHGHSEWFCLCRDMVLSSRVQSSRLEEQVIAYPRASTVFFL